MEPAGGSPRNSVAEPACFHRHFYYFQDGIKTLVPSERKYLIDNVISGYAVNIELTQRLWKT
jgi:hypothetical protein